MGSSHQLQQQDQRVPDHSFSSPLAGYTLPASSAARQEQDRRFNWSLRDIAITRQDAESAGSTKRQGTLSSSSTPVRQDQAAEPTRNPTSTTGLPDDLQASIERLAGFPLDDVRVHYHSPEPAQVDAAAYTQGNDIYVGPGQEHSLPHEAWHVVQQKQQQVRPTLQDRGLAINNDEGLEQEATRMGNQARQMQGKHSPQHEQFPQESMGERSHAPAGPALSPVQSAFAQPVAQLMKLTDLQKQGFILQPGQGGHYQFLDLGNGYHASIYPDQATWDRFPDLGKHPQQGQPALNLPTSEQFSFDEFHITQEAGGRRDHFYYHANGEPLKNPLSKYARGGRSIDWNDGRWYETNALVAELLGCSVEEVNTRWENAVAQIEAPVQVAEQPAEKKNGPPTKGPAPIVIPKEIRQQMEASKQRELQLAMMLEKQAPIPQSTEETPFSLEKPEEMLSTGRTQEIVQTEEERPQETVSTQPVSTPVLPQQTSGVGFPSISFKITSPHEKKRKRG